MEKSTIPEQIGLITKVEWGAVNRCRIYRKVLSVVDITFGGWMDVDRTFMGNEAQWHGGTTWQIKW